MSNKSNVITPFTADEQWSRTPFWPRMSMSKFMRSGNISNGFIMLDWMHLRQIVGRRRLSEGKLTAGETMCCRTNGL